MRLIGVGVGPGDPELVTLKAVRVLREAGRVFVPVLDDGEPGRAEATVVVHAGHERIERLVFSLDTSTRRNYWEAAGSRVALWLRDNGGTAAFATIGDPNVYSTFSYLAAAVKAELPRVEVSTVPGITAMQALSASAGVPLVEGEEPLLLLPLARSAEGLGEALARRGTVVVYKGGRHLPEIAKALKEAGRLPGALLGSHLGLEGEEIVAVSDVDSAPYLSAVMIPARR
ncbi:MAG TPA: precorrin-2 C(20)-methyltransferase [Candidatus Limnocylindrales bacterium]|nr:precorrin-2 C(20)-methyltransferase [Candidatus Limnocylindrales bacterium]